MKVVIFSFLLTLTSNLIFAQNEQDVENLKQRLALAKQDTSRVLLMAEICRSFRYSKPDSALQYGRKAASLAQQFKFSKGESAALSSMGWVYRELGNLPQAINMAFNALKIAKNHNYVFETALSNSLFGFIYFDLKNYSNSIEYAKKAIEVYKQYRDTLQLCREETNLGAYYLYNQQLEPSAYYLKKTHKIYVEKNWTANLSFVLRNLGVLETRLHHPKLAKHYFQQSVSFAVASKDHRNSSYNYRLFAQWYKENAQLDSCIYYAQLALSEAKSGPFPLRILQASTLLAESYKLTNNLEQVVKYQELILATNENLFGLQNTQTMQGIIEDELKHQQQIESQESAYKNRLKQYILLIGLGIFILIGAVLYWNNLQKNKANAILQTTLATLQSTQAQLIQSEKLASLGELTAGIAHEIQNPLNFVNNFAEVSAEMIDELKEELEKGDLEEVKAIAEDLQVNLGKINHHGGRASSIVKGMLEHSRTSSGVKEPTNLNTLADEFLRLAYHGLRAKDSSFNCKMETYFEPDLPVVSVISQDIGRVLLNLINNAFYAVQQRTVETLHATSLQHPPYHPTVTVSTQKTDNQIIIKVMDNGNGIPEAIRDKIFQPFFTTKPTGQGTGLGLSLAYDIVTKGHGGTLKIESTEGIGTEFSIILPVKVQS